MKTLISKVLLGPVALILGACQQPDPVDPPRPTAGRADTLASAPLHTRELVFVGERGGTPLVVSFQFGASEQAGGLRRTARAWLAHGSEWDRFLEEFTDSPAAGGVWRIVPQGNLRVIAGGPHEVEALLFRSGDRSLRLSPSILRATWAVRDDLQYRLYEGQVDVADQPLRGSVLEAYRVLRGDGEFAGGAGAVDWLFVTDGRDLQMVLAESLNPEPTPEKTFAWLVRPEAEQTWNRAEVRWLEMTPIGDARRDVPIGWSLRIPEAGVSGELQSVGFDVHLGPDRPGRRAVLLHHNVEGWIAVGQDDRVRVYGYLRHSQD
jgi:hypothetical protein